MFNFIQTTFEPPVDAAPAAVRSAGAKTMLLGFVVLLGSFALLIANKEGRFLSEAVAPIVFLCLGLPVILLWFVGFHRLLWGGMAGAAAPQRLGKLAVSTVLGFGGLVLASGVLGSAIGLIVNVVVGPRH